LRGAFVVGRDFLAASEIAEVSDGICFYVLDVGDEFGREC